MYGEPYKIRYSDSESGLYIGGYRNSFGTPLAFRGTDDEIQHWLDTHEIEAKFSAVLVYPKRDD